MIDYYEPRLDLTLLGCGFLGTYHLGALYLLSQIWPQKPYNRICGASCGGLLGVLLLVGIKLEHVLSNTLDIIRSLRSLIKNPSLIGTHGISVGELLEQKLEKILPDNAHELCSNRLGISITKLWTFENEILTNFHSRRDLIDAVCAGCFIPLWSGFLMPPIVRGKYCIDGAYSNNSPRFEANSSPSLPFVETRAGQTTRESVRQVSVSPFSCEVDVSPKGESFIFKSKVMGTLYLCNWKNLIRTTHAMLPCGLDKYRCYVVRGHRDMKDYLLRNGLVQCKQCWSGHTQRDSSIVRPCLVCLRLLERVDSLKVPKEFLEIFNE